MNPLQNSSYSFPKPLLYALILLVTAVSFKLFNQLDADYDLWFHLFMGKQNLLNGQIEMTDRYSFTAFGHPLINHEWVSQLILAAFQHGSDLNVNQTGLIIWRWSMTLAIVFLMLRLMIMRSAKGLPRAVIFLCAAIVLSRGISFRIHLFSYVFLLILLNLIYARIQWHKILPLYFISFFFMLWANIHGAFVLGLVVWHIHIFSHYIFNISLKNKFRTVCLLSILPIAATLVTPYGIHLWSYIFLELTNPLKMYITEWQHFDFSYREMPFLLVLLVTWSAFIFSRQKKEWCESLLLLLSTIMGFTSVRHTPLFAVLALPAMARHGEGAMLRLLAVADKGKHISTAQIYVTASVLVMLSVGFIRMGIPETWHIQTYNDPLPIASVQYLKQSGFKGNLWVPLHWGGYAIYQLYPHIKVSIDGRWGTVYPNEVIKDNMIFAFQGNNGVWKQLLEKYSADGALVEKENPAFQEMGNDPDWYWKIIGKDEALLIKK